MQDESHAPAPKPLTSDSKVKGEKEDSGEGIDPSTVETQESHAPLGGAR
ncbi:hypothetical protein ACWY4P_22395 [Streptomyces sp. LZ34]